MAHENDLTCWCGNQQLLPFSSDYWLCDRCQTLVLSRPVDENVSSGVDEKSLYGKSYWFEHQVNNYGYDDIFTRTRKDLPERNLHWLQAFLKYKLPPGSTLELGSAHGGFVALLHWLGFQSAGLELSPWVVKYASETYQIPMYIGKVEDQTIEPGSIDAVILLDVLEHFPDPRRSITHAGRLLKDDGILMIQTPCFPVGKTYEELKSSDHPFLKQFKVPEHIYLFSLESIKIFLKEVGFSYLSIEPAIFHQYDMFLVASKAPLVTHNVEEIESFLASSPTGRLVQALIDKDNELKTLTSRVFELTGRLVESETDRDARLVQVQQYKEWLADSETDRAARLEQLEQTNALLEEAEKDRDARWEQIQQYKDWLEESEKDRAARLEVIQQCAERLQKMDAELAAQTEKLRSQDHEILTLSQTIQEMKASFLGYLRNKYSKNRK